MKAESEAARAHRLETRDQLSPVGRKLFQFIEFDEDEELLSEIRKHPIGYIVIAIIGILISLFIFFGSIILAFNLDNMNIGIDPGSPIKSALIVFGTIFGLLGLVITAISIVLYIRNVIYVTNEKIAQVDYRSLFNRKVTQLGIGQIEDVTVRKSGIFAYIFGYGTLRVETAGELPNPEFTLVPNPDPEARTMVQAHEEYVEKYGN